MGRLSIPQFIGYQFTKLPEVDTFKADLTGKTIIVTGSNIGLGLEAARHLARMNPGKLILACRDVKKGMDALESIVKDTNCTTIDCWELDLASFDSVRAFADKFEREGGGKLDLMIENAGISTSAYKTTKDGWETTLQVNHLGTALLAFRMLPYLLKAPLSPPTPRLVVVCSEVHYFLSDLKEADSPKILEQLSDAEYCKRGGVMRNRYFVSKLLNVMFTRAFASHLPSSSPLTVNCVNPGLCHSAIMRDTSNVFIYLFLLLLARTTEVGSRTLVHAGISPELQGVTGQYLNACAVNEPSDLVISEKGKAIQQRIWDETLEILSQADPKVPDIVREYLS